MDQSTSRIAAFGQLTTLKKCIKNHCTVLKLLYGVGSRKLVSLDLFFEKGGTTVTVNSARYMEMLRTFLQPQLETLGVDTVNI